MPLIRPMTYQELVQQVQWADREGWEPGVNDADQFWQLDPEGFLAMEQEGQFLGGGAIIRHSDQFGFMGLFIVGAEHRGKGFGTQLWFARRDQLLERLSPGATIGLDGVYPMVPFYEKGGFRQSTHQRRYRLEPSSADCPKNENVVDLGMVEWEKIAQYDLHGFPAHRKQFLSRWIKQPTAISFGYLIDGELGGYGVMRHCSSGWRIGPLFCDDVQVAENLLTAFRSHQAGKPIFIDIPDANPAVEQLRETYDLKETFGCIRMYYGPPPAIDFTRVFGATTLEVG